MDSEGNSAFVSVRVGWYTVELQLRWVHQPVPLEPSSPFVRDTPIVTPFPFPKIQEFQRSWNRFWFVSTWINEFSWGVKIGRIDGRPVPKAELSRSRIWDLEVFSGFPWCPIWGAPSIPFFCRVWSRNRVFWLLSYKILQITDLIKKGIQPCCKPSWRTFSWRVRVPSWSILEGWSLGVRKT